MFTNRVREYQTAHPKHVRIEIGNYNPYPLLDLIAKYVFDQQDDHDEFVRSIFSKLSGLGLSGDAATCIVSDALMMVILVVSDMFPDMRFSDGVHVSCDVVSNGIMVTIRNRL